MFAITIDEENYIKSYSDKYRTPGSILVDSLPVENNPEKLCCYKYENDEFIFDSVKWEQKEKEAEIEAKHAKIEELKNALTSTDYKIIKCYEYALNNLELPYDAAALHEKRQIIRNKINEIEETL